jgi:hypothetical protein
VGLADTPATTGRPDHARGERLKVRRSTRAGYTIGP